MDVPESSRFGLKKKIVKDEKISWICLYVFQYLARYLEIFTKQAFNIQLTKYLIKGTNR